MKYYFIQGKPDDYNSFISNIVYCKVEKLKKAYFWKEVPECEIHILQKYIDIETDKKYVKELIKKCEV